LDGRRRREHLAENAENAEEETSSVLCERGFAIAVRGVGR